MFEAVLYLCIALTLAVGSIGPLLLRDIATAHTSAGTTEGGA